MLFVATVSLALVGLPIFCIIGGVALYFSLTTAGLWPAGPAIDALAEQLDVATSPPQVALVFVALSSRAPERVRALVNGLKPRAFRLKSAWHALRALSWELAAPALVALCIGFGVLRVVEAFTLLFAYVTFVEVVVHRDLDGRGL